MKWLIFKGLEHAPISAHASLDDAMREVHAQHLRPRGRNNIGWWFHPQISDDGSFDYVSLTLPDRAMTDAEMEVAGGEHAKEWKKRKLIPRTTDYAHVEKFAEFVSGRFVCLSIVREDRAISGMADAEIEGNNVDRERTVVGDLLASV